MSTWCLCLLVGGALTVSCESVKQSVDPQPDLSPARKRALLPQEFLYTDYRPLNEWLDTSVRVDLKDVPLSDVFRQPPLSGLNHQLSDLPEGEDEPLVTIDELALTRRQLLWALAQDHKLAMLPKFDSQGGTSFIDIRARGSRSQF